LRGDDKLESPLMPQVVRALRFYESERRLFVADLERQNFSANLFVAIPTAKGTADAVHLFARSSLLRCAIRLCG
jgi:hypothetical protein